MHCQNGHRLKNSPNEADPAEVEGAWRPCLQDSATRIWNNKVYVVSLAGEADNEADQSKQAI